MLTTALMMLSVAAVAAAAIYRLFGGYARRPEGFSRLDAGEVAVIRAIGDAFFPAGGPLSSSAEDARVAEYIETYMGWLSGGTRFLIHALLFLIEHATILFVPSWRRMTWLDPARRERYLAGWEMSRFYLRRMAFQSLRSLFCFAYCADRRVAEEMGMYRPRRCVENAVEK